MAAKNVVAKIIIMNWKNATANPAREIAVVNGPPGVRAVNNVVVVR